MYRHSPSAPASSLEPARRGRPLGRFCNSCQAVYPLLARAHSGKPSYGKDHVGATCVHEGRPFEQDADWWEPAVEVLPLAATA